MRIRFRLNLVFVIWICAVMFIPRPVSGAVSDYEVVAQNFLLYLRSDKTIESSRIIEQSNLDPDLAPIPIAWLADLKDGGYILVSVSTSLTPIKAYSLKSDFDALPDAVKQYLLSEMELNARSALSAIRTLQTATVTENESRWNFLLTLDPIRTLQSYTADTFLLTTQWNQGYPYNKFLPFIGNDQVLAGCVNVAIAQLMNYHAHPLTGNGVATHLWNTEWNTETLKAVYYRPYLWANMPDTLDTTRPEYQIDEVAHLIRDLAIANHTNFGLDASSASENTAALIDHFGFSPDLLSMENTDTDTDFFPALRSEIDALRPVLLKLPGHMTVADGYSADPTGTRIHLNLGWGGSYDNYYYLDEPVTAGTYTFEPVLSMIYNLKPCQETQCFVNLEAEDQMSGSSISGQFNYPLDSDRYGVNLSGSTSISGTRGYSNQAFYISVFDAEAALVATSDQPLSYDFAPGRYTIKVSLRSEYGQSYTYDTAYDAYSVAIQTQDLTDMETAAIAAALDTAPVIYNEFQDTALNSTDPAPRYIRIDARDENGDEVNLSVLSTNTNAVQVRIIDSCILELTPVANAVNMSSSVIVTASANGKTTQRSFIVLVTNEDVYFGKQFEITGTFDSQDDVNSYKVILDGACTITGYNGYTNQAFYTSVSDINGNVIVSPVDSEITDTFPAGVYTISASLAQNPGGSGSYYPYDSVNHWYTITVSSPDADDSITAVAGLLGIDLTGSEPPAFYTLSVVSQGGGGGTVTSTPAGISCGTDCSEYLPAGTAVELTVTADTDSVFAGWTGSDCSGTDPCLISVNGDTLITASFILKGDLDQNGAIDLPDALLALQIAGGWNGSTDRVLIHDISADQRTGMEEAIYILQKTAGIR